MIEVAYADPSDLGPPELRAQYLRLLDLPERKRFDRYVHDHHRLEFLTGRVMAKLRIAAALQIDPASVRFWQNENGRPEVVDVKSVRFSISHTRGRAACAVSLEAGIGLDVEHTGRDIRISPKCFSDREMADLRDRHGADLQSRFARYWTLKEAYSKAVGRGLGIAFDRISFDLDRPCGPSATFCVRDDDPCHWTFATLLLGHAHVLSLAIHLPDAQAPRVARWDPKENLFLDSGSCAVVVPSTSK
ncbi:4'-phosphopantetheinyl transferase family protein [Verminephrobacter eiseniae]|uniref:4'-phosphopantetheinyl transferase family protein n=1 Tax=Verminephrobacter eiseniae TaxID=364317 RepID=UPI0022448CA2|nr:4'-phosphopantetheinyl transferase superfamily protein [Verminephrobacter eiseniae]MCW5230483.1 4'-phosphopantetheinyl transferase superfamily protein [Verminephrobacter eiseniae]MCW5292216.1 4'-phosphopantetheinyl transferase superfamily protein [Verminephrobacter eiseniae]MCW8184377.1 4'-phosphopantetheinyl transferase superfamily protein [Verminephrobacter eiseniae]MCW8223185.1 4'-phosphopantetheinyl transferase superfamily protein [Verminephrobacter eiseniae]MCW8234792.1 4'-phosphopante